MVLGHIGVRRGSRGVIGKNSRILCGKPLVDWSLEQLLAHPRVGAVVVSTDDEDLYARCVLRGTLEVGLRPADLATDSAPKWEVWRHALKASEAIVGPVEIFLDLDCTSPLRLPEDIDGVLDLYERERPDMVMSVCEARKNPYFNLVELDGKGALRVSKPIPGGVWSRQAAPKVYEHAASTYALAPDYLRSAGSIYEGRVIPFEMPTERCVDIDTPLDFRVVEFLMSERVAAKD